MRGRLDRIVELDEAAVERWRQLARAAVEPNPFVEPELVLPAARHLENGRRARLLTVEHAGETVFALPVIAPVRYRHLPVRAVTLWRHPYCFLGTPLVAPGAEDAWRVAVETLRASGGPGWLAVDQLSDGPATAGLDRVAPGSEWRMLPGRGRAVALGRGPAGAGAGASTLKNARRRRKRLAEYAGRPVVTVDHATGDGVGKAVETFLALEAGGWKGRAGTAMQSRPGHAEFFRELCRGFAAQGRLQLLGLEAGDRAFAMACDLRAGDWMFNFKVAYSEAEARFSPGLMLDLDQMQLFRDSGLAGMDSCSEPDNPVANRLYPDQRALVTFAAHLHGTRGRLAVRHLDAYLALLGRARAARAAAPALGARAVAAVGNARPATASRSRTAAPPGAAAVRGSGPAA